MPWRLKVVHETHFNYESEVSASFNEARMAPMNTREQLVIYHALKVVPETRIFTYSDYFRSTVEAFDIHSKHTSLDIISENIVETSAFQPDQSLSWDDLKSARVQSDFAEYLTFTKLVDKVPDEFGLAKLEIPLAVLHFVKDALMGVLNYQPGVTTVLTTASQAWEMKVGVCQDFTHVALSLLRSMGIPARYVSGYLYTGSGDIGETVEGESHSWVEAWIGYWHPIDPTNGRGVNEDHVVVAYGRDYHDVSPLKGIFSGGQSRKIDVTVSLTRMER